MIRLIAALFLTLAIDSSHERFYTQPGSFGYSLNSVRDVMDVTPDGKIAVSLKNDPVSTHPASLTTFDPTSGTIFDNKVFGFGPLEVRVKQIATGTRVVVLTSQGGPRAIHLYDLNSEGKLTLIATTQLTTSNTDAGSNLVLSDQSPIGFANVSPGAGLGPKDLVTFSLVNGSLMSHAVVPLPYNANDRMAMVETPSKRLLIYMQDDSHLAVLDASDPAHPIDLGRIALSTSQPWSGWTPAHIATTADGHFAVVNNPYSSLEFVNLDTMQLVKSIQGGRSYGRVRLHESNGNRILAVQCFTDGHHCVLLVNATDPANPVVVNQLDLDSGTDLAFSRNGTRLFVLGSKVAAFDIPTLKKAWDQTSSFSFVKSMQLMVYGDSERVLASWMVHPGLSIDSTFGSFPYQPEPRRGQLISD
jgi:hypothetical protein